MPLFSSLSVFNGTIDINNTVHKRESASVLSSIFSLFIFGTRDLFNISYSRELYLVSKFLHFKEIVRVKMAVCFEMIVSAT